jgi:ribosomal protein S18 acetylase RimI-like enzyme
VALVADHRYAVSSGRGSPFHSLEGSEVLIISTAQPVDAAAILALQKLAYQSEAKLYNDWSLPALTQTVEALREEFANSSVLKATSSERLVGSVRAKVTSGTCAIGRLIVHPDYRGQGIGAKLLQEIEARFRHVTKFELFTGSKSEANIRLYQRYGYAVTRNQPLSATVSITFLEKPANAAL